MKKCAVVSLQFCSCSLRSESILHTNTNTYVDEKERKPCGCEKREGARFTTVLPPRASFELTLDEEYERYPFIRTMRRIHYYYYYYYYYCLLFNSKLKRKKKEKKTTRSSKKRNRVSLFGD